MKKMMAVLSAMLVALLVGNVALAEDTVKVTADTYVRADTESQKTALENGFPVSFLLLL